MRAEDYFTAVGLDGEPVSNMVVAGASVNGLHDVGRRALRNRAHLWGWVVAREHGVTADVMDAIVDAALTGVFGLLAQWASGDSRGDGTTPWTPSCAEPPFAPDAYWRVRLPDDGGYVTLLTDRAMAEKVVNATPGATVLPPAAPRWP